MDGEKELQEEKTFSIFIQTDYILNETSKIPRTKKTQFGLQPNTSPAPMYVFANVHLLEFFVRDTNVYAFLTSSKCIHEVTWSCEVKLIWLYV